MRNSSRCLFTLVLCLGLLLAVSHYSYTVSRHALHQCNVAGCTACEEIRQFKERFVLSTPSFVSESVMFAFFLTILFCVKAIEPKHYTLIGQKVRLND